VGVASDKINTRFGKRMPWYYFGFLMVIPCFLGIFSYPPFINDPKKDGKINETLQAAWYITLPALFNVGWASVQISHMSIVNQLSYSGTRRDVMVNNRNAFTYFANITVLSFALLFFVTVDNAVD
jgi:Na+/melibiose symporter-like transporter